MRGHPHGWRKRRETEGIGRKLGVHFIDLLQWFMGPPKPSTADLKHSLMILKLKT
ncbi:hypothetical protein J7L27_06030 [Candidatus Bathyarchaeota archaeon]|nr:hypothetical protein [Candidatus Bathyarchaeota archaeon]